MRDFEESRTRRLIKDAAWLLWPHRLLVQAGQAPPVEVMDHVTHRLCGTAKTRSNLVSQLSLRTQPQNLCTANNKAML